jgi:hypothetical protein
MFKGFVSLLFVAPGSLPLAPDFRLRASGFPLLSSDFRLFALSPSFSLLEACSLSLAAFPLFFKKSLLLLNH